MKKKLPNANVLYLVTSSVSMNMLTIIQQAVQAGTNIVQIRDKNASNQQILQFANQILPFLSQQNIPLIINDRLDIAKQLQVGVHLGIDDEDPLYARSFLGNDAIIGITIHDDINRAIQYKDIVDYVGVGPIFPTTTKLDAKPTIGVEGLSLLCTTSPLPVVAIGGISLKNAQKVWKTQPYGIAVCSAICHATNPKTAVKNLLTRI